MQPEFADIETASAAYAERFAGRTGAWMLRVQERIVLAWLRERRGATILDVGGGHGQLAVPLCREGFPVTVIASAAAGRQRIATWVDSGRCNFLVGDLLALPYADQAFDIVLCFRLLTHCARWPQLIAELCRVAREAVIIDYPTQQSLNWLAPRFFQAKKKLEGNTRTFRLFRHVELQDEFKRCGFRAGRRTGQFMLPMVLHRILQCQKLSAGLESGWRWLGCTRRWGSPVIMEMLRPPEPDSQPQDRKRPRPPNDPEQNKPAQLDTNQP